MGKGHSFVELGGHIFGFWTVLHRVPNPKDRKAYWLCRCRCGVEAVVRGDRLRRGDSRSCGCGRLSPAVMGERGIWHGMKDRCLNPENDGYARYGGRGITVCERWVGSFDNFYQDMGPRPGREYTLDRIDNERGYSPENCCWATWTVQRRNCRNTVFVNFRGREVKLADLLEELGIENRVRVYARLYTGWDLEDALFGGKRRGGKDKGCSSLRPARTWESDVPTWGANVAAPGSLLKKVKSRGG